MRIVGFVNESGHRDGQPMVTDYWDFRTLDAEIEAANTDTIAAGLITECRVDARACRAI